MKFISKFNIVRNIFIIIYQFQDFVKFEFSSITLVEKKTRFVINFFIKYIQRSIELEQQEDNLIKKVRIRL